MKTNAFKITITEISSKTIIVEADTESEAVRTVINAYKAGHVELNQEDHVKTKFLYEAQSDLPDRCPHCGTVHEYDEGIEFIDMDGRCINCGNQIVD